MEHYQSYESGEYFDNFKTLKPEKVLYFNKFLRLNLKNLFFSV